MRHHKSASAFLSGILLFVASPLCAQTLTATPTTPHPTQPLYVSATGFADAEAVDVYIDTTDTELLVSSSTGTFSASVTLPAGIQPGIHYITAVGRRSGDAAQSAVTVTTSWLQAGFGATKRGWNPYENTLNDSNANTLGAAWSVAANGSGATPVSTRAASMPRLPPASADTPRRRAISSGTRFPAITSMARRHFRAAHSMQAERAVTSMRLRLPREPRIGLFRSARSFIRHPSWSTASSLSGRIAALSMRSTHRPGRHSGPTRQELISTDPLRWRTASSISAPTTKICMR